MRTVLLESGRRGTARGNGAAVSTLVHAAVIAAVAAGARDAVAPDRRAPEPASPVYVAPARPAPPAAAPPPPTRAPTVALPPAGAAPPVALPVDVPPTLPPVGVALADPGAPVGVVPGGTGVPDPTGPPTGGPEVDPGGTFTAGAVDVAVVARRGNAPPRYPDVARHAGIAGTVIVRFVVDTTGRVERDGIDVRDAPHAALAVAVRQALATHRFTPARVAGRPVRQLVEQAFVFALR